MNFKLIPILSAMLLLACSPKAQTTQTAQNQPAITTNAECKNLHKVTDIDDLLHQMYTNIDSQCLFEMPTAELEKVWGIPILDYTNLLFQENKTQKMIDELESLTKKQKMLVNESDVIFLVKSPSHLNNKYSEFQVKTSMKYSGKYDNHTINLNIDNLLKLLPNPIISINPNEKIAVNSMCKRTHYQWYGMNLPNEPILHLQMCEHSNQVILITLFNSEKHPELIQYSRF